MMTDEQLDSIDARANEPRGEWSANCPLDMMRGWVDGLFIGYDNDMNRRDVEFIVSARKDIPALVAEVHRLRSREAALGIVGVVLDDLNDRSGFDFCGLDPEVLREMREALVNAVAKEIESPCGTVPEFLDDDCLAELED